MFLTLVFLWCRFMGNAFESVSCSRKGNAHPSDRDSRTIFCCWSETGLGFRAYALGVVRAAKIIVSMISVWIFMQNFVKHDIGQAECLALLELSVLSSIS
jgi:hypothetical protein